MSDYIQIYTTLPDQESAQTMARLVVEKKLGACAQIEGPIQSVYRWEEKIESSQEFKLTIKSKSSLYDDLEREIKSNHPYDVPEIIITQIPTGSADYLKWIDEALS